MDYSLLIGIHDEKQCLTKASNLSDDASDDQGLSSGSPPVVHRVKNHALSTSDTEHAGYGGDRTDSDQEDNFSPAEDLDDAEDVQLNSMFNIIFNFSKFKFIKFFLFY